MDMLKYEQRYWKKGIQNIGGIDEAGRGPLIGRVYAAAVIWPKDLDNPEIKDSKKITAKNTDSSVNGIAT